MNPCADLSIPSGLMESLPPPLPSRSKEFSSDENDEYEISVYADDDELDGIGYREDDNNEERVDRQWRYQEEPTYDDIFQDEEYIEDHFNSDEEQGSHIYYTNDDDSLYSRESDHPRQQQQTTTRVIQLGDNNNNSNESR